MFFFTVKLINEESDELNQLVLMESFSFLFRLIINPVGKVAVVIGLSSLTRIVESFVVAEETYIWAFFAINFTH